MNINIMRAVKLNDGTKMQKIVAERLFSRIRSAQYSFPREMQIVVQACKQEGFGFDDEVFGSFSISERDFLSPLSLANFMDIESKGIIGELVQLDSLIVNYKTGNSSDCYQFNVPDDVARMVNNMYHFKGNFMQIVAPTRDESFNIDSIKPACSYSR